ncbi:tellurite-like stress resistance cysteine protease StiP [Anaerolineales bacterium HSG24]|nr:tellurite-like stress resistance cysteine protease StiP [Anaerolineales bacterium HSG24]
MSYPANFCGSYLTNDVTFLLKQIEIETVDVLQRERLMQEQGIHYSQLLPQEYLPSVRYKTAFYTSVRLNKPRLAQHIASLANQLNQRERLTLVSLARAGTPIGVLLRRTLRERFNRDVPHYSISIIRDRGVDENALRYILTQHEPSGADIVFIDGWTGKGIINQELRKSVAVFNQKEKCHISSDMYVVADLCGQATVAATSEDYLIPNALLNSTINGLVSRTVLNASYLDAHDFHGCRFYREFQAEDLSLWYIDEIMAEIRQVTNIAPCATIDRVARQIRTTRFIEQLATEYQTSYLKIKPGLGEAIRVLLRRMSQVLLVQNKNSPDIEPFLTIAAEKNVPIKERKEMPYQATCIVAIVPKARGRNKTSQ